MNLEMLKCSNNFLKFSRVTAFALNIIKKLTRNCLKHLKIDKKENLVEIKSELPQRISRGVPSFIFGYLPHCVYMLFLRIFPHKIIKFRYEHSL